MLGPVAALAEAGAQHLPALMLSALLSQSGIEQEFYLRKVV